MTTRTVPFRGTQIAVSEQDYQSLAIIGAEAASRFFSHLDHEAKQGADEMRAAEGRKTKPATVEGAKAAKAKQLHDVISTMRKARGQPT